MVPTHGPHAKTTQPSVREQLKRCMSRITPDREKYRQEQCAVGKLVVSCRMRPFLSSIGAASCVCLHQSETAGERLTPNSFADILTCMYINTDMSLAGLQHSGFPSLCYEDGDINRLATKTPTDDCSESEGRPLRAR